MKVLWIAQNGGSYKINKVKGTGGWIGALQEELFKYDNNIELGIVFPHPMDEDPIIEGSVSYYPYRMSSGEKWYNKIFYYATKKWEKDDEFCTTKILEVVAKFNPDIIHIWGIEFAHSAVIPKLNKPFVVHIQGLTALYVYTYLPSVFSVEDLKRCNSWFERNLLHHGEYAEYQNYIRRAKRELAVSPAVKNWIGRTEWDYAASQLLSRDSRYFHGEEVMRNDFNGKKWKFHFNGTLHIQSNISNGWYKGIDVVLKTAEVLKHHNVEFEWHIYGIKRESKIVNYIIKKYKIIPEKVNVIFHGSVDGKTIVNSLLTSDVYVHPSYIENSSNAIAEAMYLGLPVIAQYVGGNPTMLKDGSGILVAPNEPYSMAFNLMNLRNKEVAERYSKKAVEVAERRQDNRNTVTNLLKIYNTVIKDYDKT